MQKHYAIIGTALVQSNFPLYYDAVNEKGLCMAALNFIGNAKYKKISPFKTNIAQFELIPWILGQYSNVNEVITAFKEINITDDNFSKKLPASQLHWIIADKHDCVTLETVNGEIEIHKNPIGILTNNPPFNQQLFNLNNYIKLSPKEPENLFCERINLKTYSRGMGALGLPGDLSSQSRFVRAAFGKLNSKSASGEKESVGQFFHIADTISQINGCCLTENGNFEKTIYTSCINAEKGIYYYTTYENRQISAIDMHKEKLDTKNLISYKLVNREQIFMQN